MKKFTDKDIVEIIEILDNQLNEIDTSKVKYSPDSPSQSQKDFTKTMAGDADALIKTTQQKLKSSNQTIKSKLGQYKRMKDQTSDNTVTSSTPAQKFKLKQGNNDFTINFSTINSMTGTVTFDAEGITKDVTGNSNGNKFEIKTISSNAVKCEGKAGEVSGKFWLISFEKEVKNNARNSGMISLYKDSSSDKKSVPLAWSGEMQNIK